MRTKSGICHLKHITYEKNLVSVWNNRTVAVLFTFVPEHSVQEMMEKFVTIMFLDVLLFWTKSPSEITVFISLLQFSAIVCKTQWVQKRNINFCYFLSHAFVLTTTQSRIALFEFLAKIGSLPVIWCGHSWQSKNNTLEVRI